MITCNFFIVNNYLKKDLKKFLTNKFNYDTMVDNEKKEEFKMIM